MLNGCMLLVAAMAIVSTLAGKFAGLPPFHVLIATVAIMFALLLARTPDTRWQVEALAAIGVPALVSVVYAYTCQPSEDQLKGTSALFYVLGTAGYVLTCILRTARHRDDTAESTKGEQS